MEKLAEFLYAHDPDKQPWDGDSYSFAEALRRGLFSANVAMEQAERLIELGLVEEFACTLLPSQWELEKTRRAGH